MALAVNMETSFPDFLETLHTSCRYQVYLCRPIYLYRILMMICFDNFQTWVPNILRKKL